MALRQINLYIISGFLITEEMRERAAVSTGKTKMTVGTLFLRNIPQVMQQDRLIDAFNMSSQIFDQLNEVL